MTSPKLAYLLKKFPRLSETFVLGEILTQERLGLPVRIFSRRSPDDEPRHPELSELRAAVEVLPPIREINPWQVLFADGDGQELLSRIQELTGDLAQLELPRLPSLLAEALYLRGRCSELGVTHLHVHFATDSALTAMLLRRLGGPTYSVTAHAKDIYRSTIQPAVLAAILKGSEFMVTVCDANVAHLREMLHEDVDGRVRRLYNGIDLESFAGDHGAREPGHVLSVGRLVEKKGFGVLIEALARLARRGVAFKATLVGEGEERERLAAAIQAAGLSERVRMVGALDRDGVRRLLTRAEVFALPCLVGKDGNRDALPTVLLEAQAAGLPIVSTPVTGIPEILEGGQAGILVPENDVVATAAAIERLLLDRALREGLAARGRERARALFDGDRNGRILNAWFNEVMNGSAQPCTSST